MRCARSFGAVAALLALTASACPSQDAASRPESRVERWKADNAIKDGDVIYLMGAVRVRFGDLDIRCESAIIWLVKETERPGAAGDRVPESRREGVPVGFDKKVKEVYAEGSVLVRQREEVHACESAFFDLVHQRGIIVDARTRFPISTPTGEKGTLSLQADELRFLSEVQIEAVGAKVSTCPFGNPHYHVASEKMEIYRARAREQPRRPPGEQTPNFYYTASGNTLFIGSGFPVLWIPNIAGDSTTPQGETLRYVKDIRFGRSSQFGYEPGITLGDDLRTTTGKKWGSWLLDLDYLSLRGPGAGVDFTYEQPGFFKGEIQANYQHDRGEDEFYGKPPSEDRGRFSIRHRAYLPREVQLDLETNVFSDRGYFPTYFRDEFKQDKPPETYAYMKRAFQNSAVTGLYSTRVNDWETVTEFEPRLEYVLATEPLVDIFRNPLYLTAQAELSRPKRVFDSDLDLPAISNVRADLDTLLEYPFFAGPVKLTPFSGLRTTYYEVDIARNPDRTRTGFTYGAQASTILSRTFDACGGPFHLDGLRHVIEPSVEYRRTTGVNLHPEELFAYDAVDTYDDIETFEFQLRNLFQTVRHRKDIAARVDEVFDLDLRIIYFPNAERDHGGDSWSNLLGDMSLRFSDELQFHADFEWNPTREDLEAFDLAAGFIPGPKLQTYAGFRHLTDEYDVVYAQVNWRASEKWLLRGYASYDVARGTGVEHDLVINRIGHDWVFSLILRADFGQNDFGFGIGFEPRILFDPILRSGGKRREPEFEYRIVGREVRSPDRRAATRPCPAFVHGDDSYNPIVGALAFIGGLSPSEMVIILVIGLLLFGSRLPQVGRSLGKSLAEFKRGLRGIENEMESTEREINRQLDDEERTAKEKTSLPVPVPPAEPKKDETPA